MSRPKKPDIYEIDRAQLYALSAVCEANRNRRDALLLRAAGDYIYTVRPKRKGKKPFLDAWFEANRQIAEVTDEELARLSGVPTDSPPQGPLSRSP
jgi:hypothetical protein